MTVGQSNKSVQSHVEPDVKGFQSFEKITANEHLRTCGLSNVLPGASHCFHMCSGICTTEINVFQLKNLRFFSFKCLICAFSQKFFLFYSSVWIRIRIRIQIRTFFSDSDTQIQPKYSDPKHRQESRENLQ
jgi:hypothetical protein